MDDLEDKGPRYRLVMFIAIAAIVVPGLFLMSWMGDNGVSALFSRLLGIEGPRPTRTVGALPTPTELVASAMPTVEQAATQTATTGAPATPTATLTPESTPTSPAVASPTPTSVPPTATPTVSAPPTATPTEEPVPTPTPRGDILGYGTAIPAYGGAAVMRESPTTDSEAVGSIPLGARVIVLSQVEGEAIDPVESRWWEVEYEGVTGFVYYKLIELD